MGKGLWLRLVMVALVSAGMDTPAVLARGQCPAFTTLSASAGPDQIVRKDTEVFLQGSVRIFKVFADCSGTQITPKLSINWKFLPEKGKVGVLNQLSTLTPQFSAKEFGVYWLQFTGTATFEGKTQTFQDTVVITVAETPYDLQVCCIEVTQAIQTMGDFFRSEDNKVELIEGKTALVRVYVGLSGESGNRLKNIRGTLGAFRDGVELPAPAPLMPGQTVEACTTSATCDTHLSTIRGRQVNDPLGSLNFVLDKRHTHGTIELRAKVNPNCALKELDCNNNEKSITVTFQKTRPLNLNWVTIHYNRNGVDLRVHDADFKQAVNYLMRTYPLADDGVRLTYHGPDLEVNYALDTTGISFSFNPFKGFRSRKGWDRLLQDIEDFTDCGNYFCDGWGPDPHFYGVVPAGTPTGGILGLGEFPFFLGGAAITAAGVVGGEGGGATMAQELAHNYGRDHACSPGGGEDGCDDNYVPPGGTIGDFGFDFGFDTLIMASVIPPNVFDFMTGQTGVWVGPYTFRGLFNTFKTSGQSVAIQDSQPQQTSSTTQEYLLVSGVVSPTEGALLPMYRFVRTFEPNTQPLGEFSIELIDESNNQSLYELFFTPTRLSHQDNSVGIFRVYLPWQPGTTHILLKRKTRGTAPPSVFQKVPVSPQSPSVSIIEPLPGMEIRGTQVIRWSAVDAETAMVQYSIDGGQSWRPVATSVEEPIFALNTSRLPGSNNAYLRVLVTDGVNTGIAQVGPLVVPDKAPQAVIVSPEDQQEFSVEAPVILRGFATDPEDGALTDSSLSWESDQDGLLGSGSVLQTTQLSPGRHIITFTATDSQGQPGTDQITMTILPLIPAIQTVSLAVSAMAEGQIPTDATMKVTAPSRTIQAQAPLSVAFDQGVQVQVEAPQEVRLGNNDNVFVFKEWNINDTSTSSDRVISLTLNNNTNLIAEYQPDFHVPDTTPPVITVSATPETLLQPNNTMVPVVIAGTITDNLSGVDLTSARFSVADEYELIQLSGSIAVNANGSYSFTIQLPVFVVPVPQGFGHYIIITVNATDHAGNKGSAATGVLVLYDQGK